MKKTIMALGLLSAISPVLNPDTVYAGMKDMPVENSVVKSEVKNYTEIGTVVNVKSNDVLNIRTLPNPNATIVGGMKNGSTVKITGRADNGWYKVDYNGVTGYSSNKYIDIVDNSVEGKKLIVRVNTRLNIRKGASTKTSVIGTLGNGDVVDVLSKHNSEWYKINANGKVGYVHRDYVEFYNGGTSSTVNNNVNVGKIATVTADALNIRSGAGTNYSILNMVYYGDSVKILEASSNGWYKVQLKSGATGWCTGEFLSNFRNGSLNQGSSSTGSSSNTVNNNVNVGKIATVTADALNIRSGAGTNYSVLSMVYYGNNVKILEASSNGWYKVELTSGVTGWCTGEFLSNFRDGSLNQGSSSTGSSNSGNNNATVAPPVQESTNQGTVSDRAQAVINVAKSKLGSPYVWGAEGPNSFDCSGLTLYAYRNGAGVNLPRVARDQATVGQYVSKSNLMPGDLVFFDHNGGSNINHVGIYIGGNQIIHAPQEGDVVKISNINNSYWNNVYVTARRVIN